jgi:hypothetical protein
MSDFTKGHTAAAIGAGLTIIYVFAMGGGDYSRRSSSATAWMSSDYDAHGHGAASSSEMR